MVPDAEQASELEIFYLKNGEIWDIREQTNY
jgi:hypothetical protein